MKRLLALLAVIGCAKAEPPPATTGRSSGTAMRVLRPATVVTSDSAMVVSASPYATEAGLAVLLNSGNAVDAAVTVAFTLAVTYPTAGNIGGGGFMVARMSGQNVALDFREKAPGAASQDMYVGSAGKVSERSLNGALAAGVPGSVAGLVEAHANTARGHGRSCCSRPSTWPGAASRWTPPSSRTAKTPPSAWPGTRPAPRSFSRTKFIGVGETWRAPELGAVLRRIADKGHDGFYTGETAALIVAAMQKSGRIITLEDLAGYTPVWRTPVEFDYRGHHVVSMPPASSADSPWR